jgi:hypothetical protein
VTNPTHRGRPDLTSDPHDPMALLGSTN